MDKKGKKILSISTCKKPEHVADHEARYTGEYIGIDGPKQK